MTLHPAFGLDNLGWISGSGENLSNEGVRVQGDRSDQLLQLLRGLEDSLSWRLFDGLAARTVGSSLSSELHNQTAEKDDQGVSGQFHFHDAFSSTKFGTSGSR